MDENKVMLQIKDLTKVFDDGKGNAVQAVNHVSFDVYDNEFLVLLGPGQCGKTVLLNMIAGLLDPDEGEILLDGERVDGHNPKIGMVLQKTALMPWKTVMENTEIGPKWRGVPKKERRAKAQAFLELVGLKGFEKSYPAQLSGGMKQRVGIAMGMTAQPKLLLADEPTSALDVTIQAQVVHEMKELRDRYGTTIILVTHNMGVASYLSDKIGVMCRSHLVEFGSRDEIIYHPKEQYTKDLLEAVPKLGGKRFAR